MSLCYHVIAHGSNFQTRDGVSPLASSLPPVDDGRKQPPLPKGIELPKLDPVSVRILGLLQDQDFDLRAFAEIVNTDRGLTDQLLRLASCPLYGATQKFEDLKKAIVYLGLRTAFTVTLGLSLFRCMRHGQGTHEEQWCWRRLLINAVAARELSSSTGIGASDRAFVAGLAQDFGLLLLVQQKEREYYNLLIEQKRVPQPFGDLEVQTLGYSHAAVSAAMLGSWELPVDTVLAIERHHDQPLDLSGEPQFYHLLVLAESTSDFLLLPEPGTLHALEHRFLSLFDITSEDLQAYIDLVVEGVRALADVLNITLPPTFTSEDLIHRVQNTPRA